MKKYILTAIVIAITSIATLNISFNVWDANKSELSYLSLSNIDAMAFNDEPEFGITCNQTEGRCWDTDCEIDWTPFGGSRVTICPTFTGKETDFCVSGAPCPFLY